MLSSNIIRAFALFAAAANAGPCRPTTTSLDTTTEVTSTATAIDSTTEISSTVVESSTETGTTTIVIIEEPTTTTAVIEESTTTEAASTTTAAAGPEDLSCQIDVDCYAYPRSCVPDGSNICLCIDAVCTVPVIISASTTTEAASTTTTAAAGNEIVACSTSDDCLSDAELCLDGLLNLCFCLNGGCIRVE
ncbi:hypothetical protein FPOA_06787 [Fusarium poae]|uniref:Extracellular membrane protein CFEM domain-containing protein n=1 Tax=Fusarium poae TaxID=36050 RepID=A0A1B8AIZ2_FUSPO|nr:hypothetical protein FPOA_06787 [Fusarium poae]